MKILFINLPYYGHFVPTVGLVQELIAQGCEVTYLMPFGWEKYVNESGAKFVGYANHKKLSEQIKNAYEIAEKYVSEFDLVVYEQFFFLGKHLADKYKKPVVRIFTAPVTNEKLMKEYISAGGALGIFKYKWIAKKWTKAIVKGIPMKTDNWLDEIIHNPPELNLVYTLREYQPYADEFSDEQYKFLGASIYNRKEQTFHVGKKERPLIYISLGTVVKGKTAFFRNCIEEFREEPVQVIISTGQQFRLQKLKDIPANIQVYQSVPQNEILSKADIFVTHGGMNSISEAFVQGVPMIVIPFMSDQPVNARRIEELGLGKKLEYSLLTKGMLKNTVFSVLEDNHIRNNILTMQKLIKEAPGNSGGACMIIDYYQKRKIR